MKYRVTCVTPVLVGGGQRLAAIDYMVWKDQVNVLDQTRIFKLLSRGPRLEGYLTQLRKATRLDFASWGGFAQNYAGRRIPFEHASMSKHLDRAQGDSLNIPLFAAGTNGPYLPATSVKGALRTALLNSRWKDSITAELIGKRRPGLAAEDQLMGPSSTNRMRWAGLSDSSTVGYDAFKVYMIRVSTLQARQPGQYAIGWKPNPIFAEMAQPGTSFTGTWNEHQFLNGPEVRRELRWSQPMDRTHLFAAANEYARKVLDLHARYALIPGLEKLNVQIQQLESRLVEAAARGTCLLPIGWGGGYLSKSALLDTATEGARAILGAQPAYEKAVKSGLPFPKTRHIVFEQDQPANLPGWVELAIDDEDAVATAA